MIFKIGKSLMGNRKSFVENFLPISINEFDYHYFKYLKKEYVKQFHIIYRVFMSLS